MENEELEDDKKFLEKEEGIDDPSIDTSEDLKSAIPEDIEKEDEDVDKEIDDEIDVGDEDIEDLLDAIEDVAIEITI